MEITNNQSTFNVKKPHLLDNQIFNGISLVLTLFITVLSLGFIQGPFNSLENKAITQHSTPLGIDVEYGKPHLNFAGLSERVESLVNNCSIITPNAGSWSIERVVNGRLKQYKDLGAESVLLHTQQGNQVHACYFNADKFQAKIQEMGGRFVELSCEHEFLDDIQTVDGYTHVGRRIASDENFMDLMEYVGDASELRIKENRYARGIIFDQTAPRGNAWGHFGISHSPQPEKNKLVYQGKPMWCNSQPHSIFRTPELQDETSPIQMTEKPINHDRFNDHVVVLSTNAQANVFSEISSAEILHFLSLGFNVMIYDHAGKGLSTGLNTEERMSQDAEAVGHFLTNEKGYPQEKMMFKGQCSGALPLSHAAQKFPRSAVWIDQAPQNYQDPIDQQMGKRLKLESTSPKLSLYKTLVAQFLPRFNVTENLKSTQAKQIYTIGTPDAKGMGGDQVVPQKHVDAFHTHMDAAGGVVIPLIGSRHVGKWWEFPSTRAAVYDYLFRSDDIV
jgi:hypothetical protein